MWHDYTRGLLQKKFEDLRKRNPSFSLRAFAKKLEISPGALSEVLSGRRRISRKAAQRVLSNLPLEDFEKTKLSAYLSDESDDVRERMKPEIFEIIQNWRYFAFRAACELSSPPRHPVEFARLFNLQVVEAQRTLDDLVELDLLILEDGVYKHNGRHFMTTMDIPSDAIKKSHIGSMEAAKDALMTQPVEEREFISLTFPGTSQNMIKAKKELRRLCDRLSAVMAGAEKDRVYKVAIQFYPVPEGRIEV